MFYIYTLTTVTEFDVTGKRLFIRLLPCVSFIGSDLFKMHITKETTYNYEDKKS
jgi:hypothetical protein